MNIKILKQADQFAQPPKFLVARGGDERKKVYWNFFGSWFGLGLTFLALSMCFGYIFYLINNMATGQNDAFKRQEIQNDFGEDSNAFTIKNMTLMPSLDIKTINYSKGRQALLNAGIDIFQAVNDSDVNANATTGAVDYNKLKKYVQVYYMSR